MDTPAWIQAGAAILMVGGGVWGVFEARLNRVSRTVHERLDREVVAMKDTVEAESEERKRDVERIDAELSRFGEVKTSVTKLEGIIGTAAEKFAAGTALIGVQVEGLAIRFADFKTSSDRAIDEIKHSVRAVQSQVQHISVVQARRETKTQVDEA